MTLNQADRVDAAEGAAEAGTRARSVVPLRPRELWAAYGIFIILAIFVVAMTFSSDAFLTSNNLLNLGRQISVLALISLAMLVVVVTGNADLTVGATLGLVGAVMAKTALAASVPVAILTGLILALAIGTINGFLSTRGKNLSIIVTLSMLTILQGCTLLLTSGNPVFGFPAALAWIGGSDIGRLPVPLLVAIVAAVSVYFFLSRTRLGRELYSVGGNAEASRLSGIPVTRRIMMAFIISSTLAATAGLILLGRVSTAQPAAGIGLEMDAMGAVLIGGASLSGGSGSVPKTLAGVVILGLISNGINLLGVNPFASYIVKGAVILIAILLDQWERGGSAR